MVSRTRRSRGIIAVALAAALALVSMLVSSIPILFSVGPAAAENALPASSAIQVDNSSRSSVRNSYLNNFAPTLSVPVGWTGSASSCNAGSISPAATTATLTAVNWFRGMAGLPAVTFDASLSAKAQQAALIMEANDNLSHYPPPSWNCYTSTGADAAGKSNLFIIWGGGTTGTAARAVAGYMEDSGAGNEVAGHRRWVLYPPQATMGTGSTYKANALYVFASPGVRPTSPQFIPWPTAGYFPSPLEPSGRWSFSVNTANDYTTALDNATVTVTRGGTTIPVTKYPVSLGYGNATVVWDMNVPAVVGTADQAYHVKIANITGSGLPSTYEYDVTLFDPALDVPLAPAKPAAAPADGSATVTWSAPSTGGMPITGYTVTSSPGNNTCTTTGARTCVVSGLTNGTAYTFKVRATNAIGVGPWSVASDPVVPAQAPSKPAKPVAMAGNAQATVSWSAPGNGGSPITGYLVTSSPGNKTCSTTGALTCTVTGLTNGTGYTFTVKATNAVGTSPASDPSDSVTPVTVPSKPAKPVAMAGNAQATVSWSAPGNGGSPITGYLVTSSPGNKTCSTTGALTCTVTGLTNGTGYTFTVKATNAVGDSQVSVPSDPVTPVTVPSKPAEPVAMAGNAQATVSWSAPGNGGSPITGYLVTSSPGNKTCSTTGALTCTVTGLTNGTAYTFTVKATNAAGDSQVSVPSDPVTPVTIPSKPAEPTASGGNEQVTVSWSAPGDGGSPITAYTVISYPDNKTCTTSGALACSVTGLTNGTSYTFTVRASNMVGDGVWSDPSDPVTPMTVPAAPARPTVVAGNGQVAVSWSASGDGGSPITGYSVTSSPGNKTCATIGALACTVTGLTNGTAYTFQVRATNAVGDSAWSLPSTEATPVGPPATWYHPVSPVRLIDPRPGWKVGPYSTPWNQGMARGVQVAGELGIPADAKAVVVNVTVTDVTAPGGTFISVYPKGDTRPNVSSLNASHGQTIANSVTTKIGTDGKITIYNEAGTANVIVDVAGYYTQGSGDGYTGLSPTRVIDSRPTWQVGAYSTPWNAGQIRDVTIDTTNSGVPTGVDAVVLNVTATDVTQATYVSVYPKGTTRPNASNLNLAPGNTIANQVVVKLGTANQISVYNEAGKANVVVDVVGYYASGSGDAFYPVAPERIIDPRPAWKVGPFSSPWGNQTTRVVQVTTKAGVPTTAKAVVANVTATDVTQGTFVTVFPQGDVPNASNLNAATGWTIANAVTAKLSTDGKVSVYNEKPTANIIVDVNGYFG